MQNKSKPKRSEKILNPPLHNVSVHEHMCLPVCLFLHVCSSAHPHVWFRSHDITWGDNVPLRSYRLHSSYGFCYILVIIPVTVMRYHDQKQVREEEVYLS